MATITHGLIVDMVKQKGVGEVSKVLFAKQGLKSSKPVLIKDLERLVKRYQHLNKNKSRVKGKDNLERFLTSPYIFPASQTSNKPDCSGKVNTGPLKQLFPPNDLRASETLSTVALELASELKEVHKENSQIHEFLDIAMDESNALNESLMQTEQDLQSKNKQLKRTASRETYWRNKYEKSVYDDKIYTEEQMKNKSVKILELENELRESNSKIKDLNERIFEIESENTVLKTFTDACIYDEANRTYSPETHACVYSLLDSHVAYENVGNVITSVLKLVHKKLNKLPSVGTIHNWSLERGIIAKKQISEMVEKRNTTLHTDEATKYGNKWGAFATRDEEGNYNLLGLQEMATKSSHDTLETFQNILNDIDEVAGRGTGNKLLVNIKNTMSDRASTEKKFNELLNDYRNTILPEVIDNYETLNEAEKMTVSKMNNFFCGLHSLVHLADTAQKSLTETEKLHFDNDSVPIHNKAFERAGQPGTIRLIQSACKAFARRGDAKNGCHGNFITYLTDILKHEQMNFSLQPLKGNRFNILFTNASQIYYFANHMKDFLTKSLNLNALLASVLHDLNEPFFIAGCKALGLISKLITTPFWNVIENKEITMSQMNERYKRLTEYLDHVALNVGEFMTGNHLLYDDLAIKRDKIYKELTQDSEVDDHVGVILAVMLPAFSKLIQHQYEDHLPGGQYNVIDDNETKSVDKHNKFPERVFAYADHLLASKPNIKTITMEAHVTFSLNKTAEWLSRQVKASEIIHQSRKVVKFEKQKFKQRERIIHAKRMEKQNEEFRKKEEQERRRIERMEKETMDMTYYGLWQTEEQMNMALSKIKLKTEKEEALRVQIRFRKNVFKQKCDEKVFIMSKVVNGRRVMLPVEELKTNVLTLITKANIPSPNETHLLVGKQIKHRYLEEDGSSNWYTGSVISQVPGFPEWFNVRYDGDEDIYTAKLGEEYAEGDVVIRV